MGGLCTGGFTGRMLALLAGGLAWCGVAWCGGEKCIVLIVAWVSLGLGKSIVREELCGGDGWVGAGR